MPPIAVLANGCFLNLRRPLPISFNRPNQKQPLGCDALCKFNSRKMSAFRLFRQPSLSFRIRSLQYEDGENYEATEPKDMLYREGRESNGVLGHEQRKTGGMGNSFILKLAIALGVAAALTFISLGYKGASQPSLGSFIEVQRLNEFSTSSVASSTGFTFKAFGYSFVLPEYAPGWVYFWLLMVAGCGLFISEEALNIWVGISLSRRLLLDGTWPSFLESLSQNAAHIISTVLWVYWGVCISDMVPFYLGRLFKQSGASDDVCSKLGIGEEKVLSITRAVQKYGNLMGFVERFSLGVRNPTAFLAGAMGISPEYFFAGVCCGGLVTLPIQLGIGFLLRKRPLFAVATVATAVGIWTVFPYIIAASTALFLFLRCRHSN